MPLLLDTGAIYALADVDDDWHPRVRDFLSGRRDALLAPTTVLPEAAYLLRRRLGPEAELAFARSLASAEISIEALRSADLERTSELLERYPQIGFVDATVAAMAERLRLPAIVTTDRRHFSILRPAHREAFELLPP